MEINFRDDQMLLDVRRFLIKAVREEERGRNKTQRERAKVKQEVLIELLQEMFAFHYDSHYTEVALRQDAWEEAHRSQTPS